MRCTAVGSFGLWRLGSFGSSKRDVRLRKGFRIQGLVLAFSIKLQPGSMKPQPSSMNSATTRHRLKTPKPCMKHVEDLLKNFTEEEQSN